MNHFFPTPFCVNLSAVYKIPRRAAFSEIIKLLKAYKLIHRNLYGAVRNVLLRQKSSSVIW